MNVLLRDLKAGQTVETDSGPLTVVKVGYHGHDQWQPFFEDGSVLVPLHGSTVYELHTEQLSLVEPPTKPPALWDADDGGPGQDYNSAFQDLLDPW